jgi:fructoselysine 6-kinase
LKSEALVANIATVGDNCIDRYGPPLSLSTVGGNALNVAVHLRRLGQSSAYFGAVGSDADGRRTIARLVENGVDTTATQILSGTTAFTELSMGIDGDRHILFEEFGVCRDYQPSEADFVTLARMRHVHIGWLGDGGACERRLAAEGVALSKDLAVNPGAQHLDVAFASAGPSRINARSVRVLGSLL